MDKQHLKMHSKDISLILLFWHRYRNRGRGWGIAPSKFFFFCKVIDILPKKSSHEYSTRVNWLKLSRNLIKCLILVYFICIVLIKRFTSYFLCNSNFTHKQHNLSDFLYRYIPPGSLTREWTGNQIAH